MGGKRVICKFAVEMCSDEFSLKHALSMAFHSRVSKWFQGIFLHRLIVGLYNQLHIVVVYSFIDVRTEQNLI